MKKLVYIAPEIEVISVATELGFASSIINGGGIGDYDWDNGTGEDE